MTFAVIVNLTKPLKVNYPFTSVDSGSDHFKYGVGESVAPSNGVTLWLGGDISDCSPLPFVFPAFGNGQIDKDEKHGTVKPDFHDCVAGECIGSATKALRIAISRPTMQGYGMVTFSKGELEEAYIDARTLTIKMQTSLADPKYIEVKLFEDSKRPIFFSCPTRGSRTPFLLSLSPEVLKREGVSLKHLRYFGVGVSERAGSSTGELQLTVLGIAPSPLKPVDVKDMQETVCTDSWR